MFAVKLPNFLMFTVSGENTDKVPMKSKIIAAFLKGFSESRRMAFSFLEYLFSS